MNWFNLCGHDDPPADDKLPPRPLILPPSRAGLFHTFFGSDDKQPAETADCTNMLFAAWGDDAALAARIAAAGMPTILDVSDCLFTAGNPRHFAGENADGHTIGDAVESLQARFDALRAADSLKHVAAVYVIDEPAREASVPAPDIELACSTVRAIARDYGIAPALHICGGDEELYYWAPYVDWIGVDAYQDSPEQYRDRLSRVPLKSGQKLVAYVGGADPWRTDPRDVYLLAQQNLDIIGIASFIWGGYDGKQNGIRDNGMAEKYREMGVSILKAGL